MLINTGSAWWKSYLKQTFETAMEFWNILTLLFPLFPFCLPENIKKPKVKTIVHTIILSDIAIGPI